MQKNLECAQFILSMEENVHKLVARFAEEKSRAHLPGSYSIV